MTGLVGLAAALLSDVLADESLESCRERSVLGGVGLGEDLEIEPTEPREVLRVAGGFRLALEVTKPEFTPL